MYKLDFKTNARKHVNASDLNNTDKRKTLNRATSILTWIVTPKRSTSDYIFVGLFISVAVFVGLYMFINNASIWIVLFITLSCSLIPISSLFTMFQPCTYRFELTEYGIRIAKTDNAPEFFYSATRKAAWIGCIACVIAFFAIGPLAFAGGAAFALMAPKFTQFKRQTVYSSFHFHEVVSFKYHRKSWYMSIHPHFPTETRQSVYYDHMSPYYFFIEPNKLYLFISALKTVASIKEAKEVENLDELRPIFDFPTNPRQ